MRLRDLLRKPKNEHMFVLAHPTSAEAGELTAIRAGLPLRISDVCPEGKVFVVDPVALDDVLPGNAPLAVGICSRCGTDVLHRRGRGATCACGSMQIPQRFFEGDPS